MTFKEALVIANDKTKMLGSICKDSRLDEILIVPTNPQERKAFEAEYVTNLNAQAAILPYIHSDVEVCGIYDKFRIRQDNCLILLAL